MVNWDTALSYQTAKFVRVKDKRLGALHYFFMFMILCYAVGTILYYKRYSMFETPSGLARLNVKHPDEHLIQDVGNLSYCVGGTPTKGQISNGAMGKKSLSYPCQYRDEFFAAYPQIEHDCLLITTRYSDIDQEIPAGCTVDTRAEKACMNWSPPVQSGEGKSYYLVQPENFTLAIDHSVNAPKAGFAASSRNDQIVDGKILGQDGVEINPCDDYTVWGQPCPASINIGKGATCTDQKKKHNAKYCRDIIPLMTLLRAAGITDLDADGDYDSEGEVESYRYAGLVLQVNIYYSNDVHAFSGRSYRYHYTVDHIKQEEYKGAEVSYVDGGSGERHIYDRHGIRLVFTVTGNVGHFDLPTLFIQLVTCMGLFSAATILVDKSAESCLKERRLFTKYKYENTPVFTEGEIQESLLHGDEETETLPERLDPGAGLAGPLSVN